ncbi:MAG: M4 family metallopeptidase, partial [Lentimicrobiaceae bacterium]|nr:M4 family metallopeptidase [Lentimicrobiaceae bacterium]
QEAIGVVKSFITDANSDLQVKEVQKNSDSTQTVRYFQTVSGYPIEFSALNVQVKNGKVVELNGEILDNPAIVPNFTISEEEALQSALQFVDAQEYMWQSDSAYFPVGEKVIVPDKINFGKSKLKSAYKFSIYSQKPYDKKMVYVDAETGEVILDLPLIHFSNVSGKAQTAYYGERQINMDYNSSTTKYTLRDSTRGKGIFTYDCHNSGYYSAATDFYNDSTNWVSGKYGTDAHFSTTMTYDYYLQKHNRNSIDNNGFRLISYVNFDLIEYGMSSNVNAFWNGTGMTYGRGNPPNITPLTAIDICGHEITHGLTQYTAGLAYQFESGALNEAFSDIFGKAIEYFAVPEYASWTIGEKIGYTMRDMSNPNLYGDPNTYQGQYWEFTGYDNGGVHTNSGVLNYWFYLLCDGGSGINDFGNSYNVAAIGMNNAEQVAFKLLTQYLTENSEYEDACFYGLQAATDLFGSCSDELKSVGDAFYAVGLLDKPYEKNVVADFFANITESCKSPTSVQFTNKSYNGNSYLWDFGDGSTSVQKNPTHTYNSNGNFTVTLIVNSNDCGTDTIEMQNYINIDPYFPCTYFMTWGTQNVEGCRGIIYDDGGPNNPHSSNLISRITVHSPGADSIILNFIEFELEGCTSVQCDCDYLSVYRGNSTSSTNLIGKYCDMNLPKSRITVAGEYVTFYFLADPYVNLAGFKIEYTCINSDNPPIVFFDAENTVSCEGIVHFSDQSVGTQIDTWLWDFGDGRTSTLQNPTHQYYKNGTYNVTLTAGNANGEHSQTKTKYIVVKDMNKLADYQFEGDENQSFELHIPDGSPNLKWYENNADNLFETTPVFTGNTIQHSALSTNKTYYISDSYEGEEYRIGETVCTGVGSFFNADVVHYLVFDAYQAFNLKSVLVNANNSGNRTIMLKNARQDVIWTKTVSIPYGTSRITIDKEVPAGLNLQLACQAYPNLFRSDVSANLNYPYTIEDVVRIKKSSASGDELRYYYFFYDWEIKLPDCNSELSTVSITSGNSISENVLKNVVILPNPSTGKFSVVSSQFSEMSGAIEIFDVVGSLVGTYRIRPTNDEVVIDISHLSAGMYFLKMDNKVFKVVKL